MTNNEYHVPVLLEESIEGLSIKSEGSYVDATFGGGGHSREILKKISSKGNLYAFDQDEDAVANIEEDEKLIFIHSNFRFLKNFMEYYKVDGLDGVLLDLGVSSFQFDSEERGFSFRFEQDLDMRMSSGIELDAKRILSEYSAEALQEVFSKYGEVRNSKSLANRLVADRSHSGGIDTTAKLNAVLGQMCLGERNRYFAQVYQALRIEVNDEMGVLKTFLESVGPLMNPGGRLVVISYHSLEDRIVKQYMKTGNVEGELIKDNYGKIERSFKLITKKPFLPSSEEMKINPRARSAKMRIAEKI